MKMFRTGIVFLLLIVFLVPAFALASAQVDESFCSPGWTNGFYDTYAGLESSFGSYDEWPSDAKEKLLPFFTADSAEQLDSILADRYGDGRIDMVTLYSVLVGDYNAIPVFWDEESRLKYADLLMKYNLPDIGWIDVVRPDDIITPDEAIYQSRQHIINIGLASREETDQLKYYWSYGHPADQKTACYEINIFTADGEALYTCYVFQDLTVKETFEPVSEDPWIDEEVLNMMQDYASCHEDIPDNASFAGWPLDAKEYFSLHIAPLIWQNSLGREDVYSPADLLAAAQYEYGLPDEKSIPIETAQEIARQELIKSYHLDPDAIKEMDVCIFYDITDQENPLWKFLFSFPNEEMDIDKNIIYKIHISAYDSTIMFSDSWNFRKDAHTWENLMRRY